MTFSIIGTGNIAWFLGNRLVTARHRCTGVYSRKKSAAKTLGEALLSDTYGLISDIKDGEADVCFLAISDTAINQVAAQLSFSQTVIIHTAGAVDINELKTAAKNRAVLWPVYSILKNNLPDHRNIPCAWEASTEKAKKYVLSLGHAISDELFEARFEQRKWLHVAAVMSNNFTTHLMTICNQICTENNLPFSTLLPIIHQTFDRLKNVSPHTVQTGPAIRGDDNTIREHLALLGDHPIWQNVYKSITESIQSRRKI
jgi:predicted short-subunit dehydrogenase-like oxidoreductase (DUF2520 family)